MQLTDNADKNRFEIQSDSKTAFIDYIINKKGVMPSENNFVAWIPLTH